MIYNVSPIFDYVYRIIIKVTFSFPNIVSACKESAHFIFEIQHILEPQDQKGHLHF